MVNLGGVTLQQVHHFVAAAETGQVSRAAARCHISQPSMSASLSKLEQAVGRTLLERHREGLRVTPEGELFLRYARSVLTTMRDGLDDVRGARDRVAGTVRVGVSDTITGYLLPAMVQAMRRHLPGITLELVERERADLERSVVGAEVDFAVALTSNVARRDALACETLLRSKRRLWLSPDHPFAGRDEVGLAEVAACSYLVLDMDEHVDVVRRYWQEFDLTPNTVFRSRSIEGICSLVADGLGVTILSDLVYRPWSHDAGRIVRKPIREPVPTMDVGLVTRAGTEATPAAEAAAGVLRMVLKDMARQD